MALRNKLLVINAGSSSLKFKLFEILKGSTTLTSIGSGLCERIGDPERSIMRATTGAGSWRQGAKVSKPMPDHQTALQLLDEWMADAYSPHFHQEVHSVGHRVVHGGRLSAPSIVSAEVHREIERACELAPLHDPPNLHGIDAAMKTFSDVPHVAVFDTTFHATLPPDAYTYALPQQLCQQYGIRRYGFHGIRYHYLTKTAARMLGKEEQQVNLILCHLGAGSSMCAVEGGKSVDTSMGFTPLEGLMMGSRCGDIDPAIVPYLMAHGLSSKETHDVMNFKSGFLGMAGNVDVRSVEEAAAAGDQRSQLAINVYVHRIRKYLGAYLVHLRGRVDAIVFSAGIGENGDLIRHLACRDLEWAGVALDPARNAATVREVAGEIQAPHSRVKVLVIPTDEQLEIAQQTLEVVNRERQAAAWA